MSLTIVEPGKEPWEKLSVESAKAFAAFKVYRDMPAHKRSLAKSIKELYGEDLTSKEFVSKLRQYQTWSAKFQWVERSDAWDVFQDSTANEERIQAIKDMVNRHVAMGKGIQQKAITRLKNLEPNELTPELVLRYIEIGMKIERTSMGEPTEITENINKNANLNLNLDATELSTEELRKRLYERSLLT